MKGSRRSRSFLMTASIRDTVEMFRPPDDKRFPSPSGGGGSAGNLRPRATTPKR